MERSRTTDKTANCLFLRGRDPVLKGMLTKTRSKPTNDNNKNKESVKICTVIFTKILLGYFISTTSNFLFCFSCFCFLVNFYLLCWVFVDDNIEIYIRIGFPKNLGASFILPILFKKNGSTCDSPLKRVS